MLSRLVAIAVLAAAPAAADVTGVAVYETFPTTSSGLNYAALQERPVRGARIQLRSAGSDTVLAEATTGADGSFRLGPGSGGELEVVLIAESVVPPVVVQDNTDGGAVWGVSYGPLSDGAGVTLVVPAGWLGTAYDPATRLSGPFAILDAAWASAHAFFAVRSVVFPPLAINWSPDNRPESGDRAQGQIGTSFWDGRELFILGKQDVDTDEFDSHVVVHEWGHYFESAVSRSDSIGGSHSVGDLLDARVAFGEGWGNALSAMVLFPDSVYADSLGPRQEDGFGYDLEDNSRDPAPGWFSESTVQTVLYDLFDTAEDRADRVALGLGPIYDVMTGPQRSTRALTTLFSFSAGLAAVAPQASGGLDALLAQHAVAPVRDSFGSGESNDGGVVGTLPVYNVAEIDGAPITLTLLGTQPGNWVGQNRYVGFTGNGRSVTVSATTDADVALEAFDAGRSLGFSDGFFAGTESVSFATVGGQVYVVVVSGFAAAGSYTCTLQVTAQ